MTRQSRFSPVGLLRVLGALVGIPIGLLGVAIVLGLISQWSVGSDIRTADGVVVSKWSDLAPVSVGRQLRASDVQNFLEFRFDDAQGTVQIGRARVSITQFNALEVGEAAVISFDLDNADVVWPDGPPAPTANFPLGLALLLIGGGMTLGLGNAVLRERRGYGLL